MQYLVLQGLKSECIAFLEDVAPLLHICLHITALVSKHSHHLACPAAYRYD